MSSTKSDTALFKKTVKSYYKKHGRHNLPWRKTTNPYGILVSEVMLQQTQVDRVIPYYRSFLEKFPTVEALAKAPLGNVIRAWSGLGYNRRAKYLHEAAKIITTIHRSEFPREYEKLVGLPGVGDYTAKAVRVFAFNEPEVMIETNIRAVFLHHFFPGTRGKIFDRAILQYIEVSLDTDDPSTWYAALMDYGAYVKKTHPNPSRKSAHHAIQKSFRGSDREIRGAILRAAAQGTLSRPRLDKVPFKHGCVKKQLDNLIREGLIRKRGERYVLPS